jgi:hypothetical protein
LEEKIDPVFIKKAIRLESYESNDFDEEVSG